MGIYVNPGKDRFIEAISSDIYVDKYDKSSKEHQCKIERVRQI